MQDEVQQSDALFNKVARIVERIEAKERERDHHQPHAGGAEIEADSDDDLIEMSVEQFMQYFQPNTAILQIR